VVPRRTVQDDYEAIEFEPSIPQAKLPFDLIRANLAEESRLAGTVRGVFGNAQQPLMVLPNIWFFAQAARNPAYRSASDEQMLRDLAEALGGASDGRVAWNVVPDRQRELVAAWAKTLDAGQVAAIRAAVPDATKHLLDAILPR
jgi:hypothetical protein